MPCSASSTMKGAQTSSQHGPAIDVPGKDCIGPLSRKKSFRTGISRAAAKAARGAGTKERNLRRSNTDIAGVAQALNSPTSSPAIESAAACELLSNGPYIKKGEERKYCSSPWLGTLARRLEVNSDDYLDHAATDIVRGGEILIGVGS